MEILDVAQVKFAEGITVDRAAAFGMGSHPAVLESFARREPSLRSCDQLFNQVFRLGIDVVPLFAVKVKFAS